MTIDLGALLVGQLEFYWDVHLRPRLDGLTDEEFFWEPTDGCWSVRADASGVYRADHGSTEPALTTIAWRVAHIGSCLGTRASTFFGDGSVPADAHMFDPRHEPADLPGSAADALGFLEHWYARWHDGIASLDADALAAPLGPRGAGYADDTMAALIVHNNREVMHHGGEIGVLRDLFRATGATHRDSRLRPV